MSCSGPATSDDGGRAMDGSRRVALFTITLDRLEYTRRTFETLEASTRVPFDHFVVDNGSRDGTVEYLLSKPGHVRDVRLNPSNVGLDEGTNQALDLIGEGYDFIVKVDNDCEFVDEGWLEALIAVSESFGRRMAVSPRTEGLGPAERDGGHPRSSWVQTAGRRVGLTDHVGGLCLLAPAWMYDRFRYRKNPMHGNQDVLFSLHVRMDLGCRLGYVEDVRVRHMDTTDGQVERFPEYFSGRDDQHWRVYGEPALVTRLMAPPRRMWLLWRMGRGGLLEGGMAGYASARLRARASRLLGRSVAEEIRPGAGPTPSLEVAEAGGDDEEGPSRVRQGGRR